MDIHVSLDGSGDLAGEIYRQLRAAMLDGRLVAGGRLPPTRELAARLKVSRTTVTVAYDRLVSEGFAEPRRGSGTFVSSAIGPVATAGRAARSPLVPRPVWVDAPLPPPDLWRPGRFDFRPGIPEAGQFPHDAWRGLVGKQLQRGAVGRGTYADPAGHPGLRAAIARHVGTSRGVHCAADDVVITSGTQQAVDVIARVLLAPGDLVAVEDPGYPPPRQLFASLGARVAGVRVDAEGIVVPEIPPGTRLVYVSPSHQFPLGMSMSLRRRVALIAWAERHGAAIVEDDYDSEFRYGDRPIEPLHSLDTGGHVLYVGSFSKSMLPTLRLGFVIVPLSLRRAVTAAKFLSDWHSPLAMQAALAAFIERGWFARHVRRMRTIYRDRHECVVSAVGEMLADELTAVPSSVGLHVGVLAGSATHQRIDDGVRCHSLSSYSATPDAPAGLVLGYGAIAAADVRAGMRRLRAAFTA